MSDTARTVIAVLGGLLALVLITVSGWALTVAWAPWKGAGDVRKQTQGNAAYRIAAYDHFYNLCAGARTVQQNTTITRAAIKQAPTAAEKYRQQTNLQAQENQLNELVNEYNADARKNATLAQFRASDLPYTLNPAQEITCTA